MGLGLYPYIDKYPDTDLSQQNLDWLISTVKSCDERMTSVEELVHSLEVMTPEQIEAKIQSDLSNYDSVIKEYINLRDNETLLSSKNYTDNEINIIKMLIESKKNEAVLLAKEYTDTVKELLEREIDDKIVDYSFMISPFTGEHEEISEVIYQMINTFHRSDAINVTEFDNVGITVEAFDNLNLSAFNFDFYAKQYIN